MVLKDFGKLNKKPASEVLFASNGTFFALVNKDAQSATQGALEFGFFKPTGVGILCVPEICKVANMPYMTMASYDPTGRFLITGSKDTKTFIVWNAYGEQIFKDTVNANSFLQVFSFLNLREMVLICRFAGGKDQCLKLIGRKRRKSLRISKILSRNTKNMMTKSSIKSNMKKKRRGRS